MFPAHLYIVRTRYSFLLSCTCKKTVISYFFKGNEREQYVFISVLPVETRFNVI